MQSPEPARNRTVLDELAHQLNNEFARILPVLEIVALEDGLDEELQSLVASAGQALRRAAKLVECAQAEARGSAGTTPAGPAVRPQPARLASYPRS